MGKNIRQVIFPAKNGFKSIIIILLVALLFIFSFSCKKESTSEEAETEVIFGPTYDVGEIIVNLADLGQARYAKIQTVLELSDEAALDEITTRSPQVRDIVIEIFSVKKAEELLELETRNGIKKEIFSKINSVLQTGDVKNVYFITMVVQ